MGLSCAKCGKDKNEDQERKHRKPWSFKKKKKLVQDLDAKENDVTGFKQLGSQVGSRVSQLDRDLVDSQVRNIDRRYNDVRQRSKRRNQTCEVLIFNRDQFMKDIQGYVAWMKEKNVLVRSQERLGYSIKDTEDKLHEHNALVRDIESHNSVLENVTRQGKTILPDLSNQERVSLEKQLQNVQIEHNKLQDAANKKHKRLSQSLEAREFFHTTFDRVLLWIQDKERVVSRIDNLKLQSSDVERQLDKYKTLLADVRSHESSVEEVTVQGRALQEDCDDDSGEQLNNMLKDLETRYQNIRSLVQDHVELLRNTLILRRQFESDWQMLEVWLKEVEVTIVTELRLECSLEMIEEQLRTYQDVLSAAEERQGLLDQVVSRGEAFLPDISDAERLTLEQQLKSVKDRHNRIITVSKQRSRTLEDSVQSRSLLEGEVAKCDKWLTGVQEEVKRLNKPISYKAREVQAVLTKYEKLQQKLSEYEPTITSLNKSKEDMMARGQVVNMDEVTRLTSLYDQLSIQVTHQCTKLEQAVLVREQYETLRTDLEGVLKQCQEQLDAVNTLGIPTPTKLDRYKAVGETLHQQEVDISHLGDKAQQIGIEGTGADVRTVTEHAQNIKLKHEKMTKMVDKKSKELEKLVKERQNFEKEMDKTLEWLQLKLAAIKVQEPLGMQVEEVQQELKKHQATADEINAHLKEIQLQISQQRVQFEHLEEIIPLELSDKLEQYETYRVNLQGKLHDRAQFLQDAKNNRRKFDERLVTVTQWLQQAEEFLQPIYDGIEFENVEYKLQEHKEFFATEVAHQEDMRRLLDVAEKLYPTLDHNDAQTLRQSLDSMQQKLAHILTAAGTREGELARHVENWNDYQDLLEKASQTLKVLELRWEALDKNTATTTEQARIQVEETKIYITEMELHRDIMEMVNMKARELSRVGNEDSRNTVERMMMNIDERWKNLTAQADIRQASLQEFSEEWQVFNQILEKVDYFLTSIEGKVPRDDPLKLTATELKLQLADCRSVCAELHQGQAEVTNMKRAAQTILNKLPTSESRIALQRKIVALQDRHERLEKEVESAAEAALAETESREVFQTDLHTTIVWMEEALKILKDLGKGDLKERLETHKTIQRELVLKREHIKTLVFRQREKYGQHLSSLPLEMNADLENYQHMEKMVEREVEQKEREFAKAQQIKTEYQEMLKTMTTWLNEAEVKLSKKMTGDLEANRQKYQELWEEFDLFKAKPDQIQQKAEDVLALTKDTTERQAILSTMVTVNERWLKLQEKTISRRRQLDEAAQLQERFNEGEQFVISWVSSAEILLNSHLSLSSQERVKQQLQEYQATLNKSHSVHSKLDQMTTGIQKIAEVCDVTSAASRLAHANTKWLSAQTQLNERIANLEETLKEWQEYEKELSEISVWLEHWKAERNRSRDTGGLKEQLQEQEKLLDDLEGHKSKVYTVLAKHEELRSRAGDHSPTRGSQLAREISAIEDTTRDQRQQIRAAIAQQEQYEAEIHELTTLITTAQQKLTAVPVKASSPEGLKKQIAEHNALTAQIRTYQERIQEVNEKSRILQERALQLSPTSVKRGFNWGSDRSLESDSSEIGLLPKTPSSMSLDSVTTRRTSQGQPPPELKERTDSGIMMSPEGSLSSKHAEGQGHIRVESSASQRAGTDKDESLKEMVESALQIPSPHSEGWSASSVETVLERQSPGKEKERKRSPRSRSRESSKPKIAKTVEESVEGEPESMEVEEATITKTTKVKKMTGLSVLIPKENVDGGASSPRSHKSAQSDDTDQLLGETPEVTDEQMEMHKSPDTSDESKEVSAATQRLGDTQEESLRSMVEAAMRGVVESPVESPVDVTDRRESPGHLTVPEDTESILSDQGSVSDVVPSPITPSRSPGKEESMQSLAELNTSWNTLQAQLGLREQELQAAMQKQEDYQQALQQVTARIEEVKGHVDAISPDRTKDLDQQLRETKDLVSEIEAVQADMALVKEKGRQLSTASEPEGPRAMQATLTVLTDRLETLKAQAVSKRQQTELMLTEHQKHEIVIQEYEISIQELEEWLSLAKIEAAGEMIPVTDMAALGQQLRENKNLQIEINSRLQQISDLVVQCESMAEMESPETAEHMRAQITQLQATVSQFKLETIDKQTQIKDAIRDCERQADDTDEDQISNLQQWIEQTRKMSLSPKKGEPGAKLSEESHKVQEQLGSDLAEHQQLLITVSSAGKQYVGTGQETPLETRADVISTNWEFLAKQAADKKQHLQDTISRAKSGDQAVATPLYLERQKSVPEPDTTTKMEEVKIAVLELSQCLEALQSPSQDPETRMERVLRFQQQYQESMTTVTEWLDIVQSKLFSTDTEKNVEDQLTENEALFKEIRSLQDDVRTMNRASQQVFSEIPEKQQGVMRSAVADVSDRLRTLEGQSREKEQTLREKNKQWKTYQTEVKALQTKLNEAKKQYISSAMSGASLDQQLQDNKRLEESIKQYETKLKELRSEGEELLDQDPRVVMPAELNILQATWQQLQHQATHRKSELQRAQAIQTQYEKMIKEYAEFLETAQDKLRSDTISATDLDHMKQQLKAHKDFFSDLESHRALLDALAQKTDHGTRQKYFSMHTRLINLTNIIQDKASIQGQVMERTLNDWSDFDQEFSKTRDWLEGLERRSPARISGDESVGEITSVITEYQAIQRKLNDEKGAMYQVVDKGKQLAQKVNCPGLESKVATFAERWVAVNNDTNQELRRLENLVEQRGQFEKDAVALETWLMTAQNKIPEYTLNESELSNITAIRRKTENFLEFRKEVAKQHHLKNKVATTGSQLLRSTKTDPQRLRSRLNNIEETWLQLLAELTGCEERLHQAQMELLPSRQALSELLFWIDSIEKTMQQDRSKSINSLLDIQILLSKYTGIKIDLQNKQLTVDFINQAILEMSIKERGNKRTDKTDLAEKLGQLNTKWQSLATDVAEKLKSLEMLQVKWEDYEKRVKALNTWFEDQEARVKRYHRIGHEVSCRQALKECKTLEAQLHVKEDEIESVKKLGMAVMDAVQGSTSSVQMVKDTVDKLNQHWASLDHQVCQLQNTLDDILRQWDSYHASQQAVNQLLTETEYLLSRYNTASGDTVSFKSQLERLKNMQSEFSQQRNKLTTYTQDAGQLVQVCEPVVSAAIQRGVTDTKSRWDSVVTQLQTRAAKFEKILRKWEQYEEDYEAAKTWVEEKEKQCNELLLQRDDAENKNEHLSTSRALKQELDDYQSHLVTLNKASDQLTKHLDNTTVISVTSKETALNQRLATVKQAIFKHVLNLQNDLAQQRRFDDLMVLVLEFLTDADNVLRQDDPNKSSDEHQLNDRLQQLQTLSLQFNTNQSKLDSLNGMGYRLPLSEKNSERLKMTNQKWQRQVTATVDRCKTMQGFLLLHHDFQQKCEAWMTFLAQVEQSLAVDIAGSYEGLQEQQKVYEHFQSQIYSRQQILHSVISEGQQMMCDGAVEERQEFQRRLNMLDQQWQSVVRRANQRKAIIDNNILQWQTYRALKEKLSDWLREMDDGLHVFEFTTASLQQIGTLIERLKTTQKDMAMHESMYQKVHEAGKILIHNSDHESEKEIRETLADIQQHWFQIIGRLDGRREHLEGILKQWHSTEEGIEDVLIWLKEMRRSLALSIPQKYDDLQREYQQCLEFETAFANAMDKRHDLEDKKERLKLSIAFEDLSILDQRLLLLTKQWDEISNQVLLRKQSISDRMNEWNTFNEKYKEMCNWLVGMETKVSSNKEYHIEDLLEKLQKDYKDEISTMQINRDDLIAHGHRLMKASSEVRANDIEYKISKLNDKWTRLQELVAARLKKLQDTLRIVQELDVSMSNLRQWLAYIEHELGSPVAYQHPDLTEIHRKLQNQQDLQADIERRSGGISSVLNLCQVLLQDTDACPTEVEVNALQQARKSLDKRWRNIYALSMERRLRIEETWRLWQKFTEDYKHFLEWLKETEKNSSKPKTGTLTFMKTKQELKKFENIQRSVHENLSELELLNKQYRRLARESRTDTSGTLKAQISQANNSWDKVSKRLAAIIRRMKHTLSLYEDFKTIRGELLTWLTNIDMKLTDMEHFSELDITDKLKQMKEFQKEIDERGSKLKYVDQAAGYLLQKCEPGDAVKIQRDLDEFHQLCEEVFSRVRKYQTTLHTMSLSHIADYHDWIKQTSPENLNGFDSEIQYLISGASAPSGSPREFKPRSDTPASLDWDMYEVEKLLAESPPDSPKDEPMDSTDATHLPEQKWSTMQKEISAKQETLSKAESHLSELERIFEQTTNQLSDTEKVMRCKTPSGPEVEKTSSSYTHLITSVRSNIETIHSMRHQMKHGSKGLGAATVSDHQLKGVIHRWELIKAQALAKEQRLQKSRQQWLQFMSDIRSISVWLDEAEAIQGVQGYISPDIKQLEITIRRHREFLLQLDSRKAIVLSINLLSKKYTEGDSQETRDLKERLHLMNQRWDMLCSKASLWQKKLQVALLQCQEFHQTIHDLLLWLETVETKIKLCEPVDLDGDKDTLQLKYNKFKDMKTDLERSQPRVVSLKETADQLLSNTDSKDAVDAKEKLHIISNRLRSLLRMCVTYNARLETALGIEKRDTNLRLSVEFAEGTAFEPTRSSTPRYMARSRTRSSGSAGSGTSPRSPNTLSRQLLAIRTEIVQDHRARQAAPLDTSAELPESSPTRRKPAAFLVRVCRAALPLQMLLLLLLGIACLIPMAEEEHYCEFSNNFQHSWDPMLRYLDGPPPV